MCYVNKDLQLSVIALLYCSLLHFKQRNTQWVVKDLGKVKMPAQTQVENVSTNSPSCVARLFHLGHEYCFTALLYQLLLPMYENSSLSNTWKIIVGICHHVDWWERMRRVHIATIPTKQIWISSLLVKNVSLGHHVDSRNCNRLKHLMQIWGMMWAQTYL